MTFAVFVYYYKYTKWSEGEEKLLIDFVELAKDLRYCSLYLGRTPKSILARVERLMLQGKFPVESDPHQWLKDNKI